ncbi:MAG: hypothetical protein N2555_05760 [Endomicrobia bacterium]|nr:hypothetical protein [Endomicrobiia bacterium]
MKHTKKLLIGMICFITFELLFSAVPSRMNFQGRLLDQNKNPRSGLFNMTFSIWDAPTGGSQIWSETQTNVQVTNGMFSVQLGAVNPLTADVFSSDNRWLQIQVGDEVLQPRERLVSVAYSLRASVAQSVVAGSITNNEISDTANIAWSKISKAGSSLADLATRSASDLNTGILPSGRLSGNYFNDVKVSSAIYADFAGNVSLGANSVGSYHIIDSTITSADIKDGEITNADVSLTANIDWAKISKVGSSLADLEIRSASDINSGVLSASRGGTGISGAGGVANRVLITTDGNNWTAGQVSPTTMIAAGTLPSNVVASSIAVNTVYTDSIQNNAVTSLKIADGTITDADISSTANISDTKLATITTANKVSWAAVNKAGSSLADLATKTLPQLDDVVDFTAQQGDILVRTATAWDRLPAGTSGYCLITSGPNSEPYWGVPVLISSVSTLGANITMATAGTWYDGAVFTLGPGTWFITAHITMGFAAATAHYSAARISDGTNHYAGGQQRPVATNPAIGTISMSTIVTLTATTTIRLQGTSNTANCIMYATSPNYTTGPATQMVAIRIR